MLMMAGGGVLALIRFWMAIRPPKVVVVFAQAAISMAALGAEALAHSASRMASASSGAMIPGARQLLEGCEGGAGGWACVKEAEGYPARPKGERKVLQSQGLNKAGASISTMVWPWHDVPASNRGFR